MPVAGGAVGPLAPPIVGPALSAATTITARGSFARGLSVDVCSHSISIDAPPPAQREDVRQWKQVKQDLRKRRRMCPCILGRHGCLTVAEVRAVAHGMAGGQSQCPLGEHEPPICGSAAAVHVLYGFDSLGSPLSVLAPWGGVQRPVEIVSVRHRIGFARSLTSQLILLAIHDMKLRDAELESIQHLLTSHVALRLLCMSCMATTAALLNRLCVQRPVSCVRWSAKLSGWIWTRLCAWRSPTRRSRSGCRRRTSGP